MAPRDHTHAPASLGDARAFGVVAAIATSLIFAATTALAAWPPSGLPLATGPAQQVTPFGLTGPGGELHAFWIDQSDSPYALYTQHVTLQGTLVAGWPTGGRGVVAAAAAIGGPKITPDGSGGAIVVWYDYRESGGPRGIYGIRVNGEAAPAPGWNSSGTPICTATNAEGYGPLNDLKAVCSDGAGGAFVAWTDARNKLPASTFVYDIFAQHVLANGTLDPSWPATGRGLTSGPGFKYPHVLLADGSGGFWLVTENADSAHQVRATHHGADGIETHRWTTPAFATRVVGVGDGAGGVFLTWRDFRNPGDAIYAIRLGPGAIPPAGWPIGGVSLAASPFDENLTAIIATGDGAAMVAWLETGPGPAPDAYRTRRVEADGSFAPAWQSGDRAFATSNGILSGWPLMARDGVGGAMFAFRRNNPNLFGSRVDAAAQVPAAFPDTGLSLCAVSGEQFLASMVSDGMNGAYVLWEDHRVWQTNEFDLYVTRFTRDGDVGSTTDVPPTPIAPGLAMSAPRPNPSSSSSSFELTMATAAHARVEVFDLAGRRLMVLHDGDLDAGTTVLAWDGRDQNHRRVPPGLYLVRTSTASATVVGRIVRMPQ